MIRKRKQFDDQLWDHLRNQLYVRHHSKIYRRCYIQIRDQLRDQLWDQFRNHVIDQVRVLILETKKGAI